MKKKAITEKDKDIIEGWVKQTDKVTLDNLPAFLRELTQDYEHDYGTICHAVAIGAVAAAKAVNRSEQGGITGFQAGAVFWEFYKRWLHEEGPARLVKYGNMLYPQYRDDFAKTISKDTWAWLQDEAKKNLKDGKAAANILFHWESIARGKVPFGYKVRED
jgi:hypothetical protein